MASIQEILVGQGYKGDATSGGGAAVGVTLDTSPFQKLADFTFYQNRDKWERQNKKDDQAAQNIADVSAIDPSSPIPEQYQYLSEKKNEILKEIESDPSILDYQKNPQGWLKINQKISDWANKRKKATANDLIYQKRKTEADDETNPEAKGVKQKLLEEDTKTHFASGVENALTNQTILRSGPELKADDYKIPDLALTSYKVAYVEPNTLREVKWNIVDTDNAWVQSGAAAFGLMNKGYVYNANLSKEENDRMKAVVDTNLKMGNMASFQEVVDKYNTWMQKKASNPNEPMPPQIAEIVQSIETYNQNAEEANKELEKMVAAGKKPQYGKHKLVDASQLDVQEYLFMNAMHGKKIIQEYTEDLSYTGDATKIKLNREDNAAAMSRAMLPYTMAKLGTAGSGSGKASGNDKAILEPSMFFRENAIRLGDWFRRNPNSQGMVLTPKGIDPATSEALGIGKDGVVKVTMRKDGSFIKYDANDKQVGVGTPEEMFRMYKVVSAGKMGLKTDKDGNIVGGEAGVPEGWQLNVEDGMTEIFGTKNAGEAFKQSFNIGMQKDVQGDIPTVNSKEEYDKLKSGQIYLENGVKYKKP